MNLINCLTSIIAVPTLYRRYGRWCLCHFGGESKDESVRIGFAKLMKGRGYVLFHTRSHQGGHQSETRVGHMMVRT